MMDWKKERDYIRSIDPQAPGSDFNNDPACFKRYVAMQGEAARRDGALAIAGDLKLYLHVTLSGGEPITAA